MKMRVLILATALLAFAVPATAQTEQFFDFLGQAQVPAAVGGTLSMYSVVNEALPATTPLPLDFANYEYTLVITGLVLDVDGSTQVYSGGSIVLYEDNGTAADYAATGTFVDGTPLLSGTFTILNRTMFTSTIGTVNGYVDWTGGTRLDDIAPWDQDHWAFLPGVNTRNAVEGFDEVWDGKLEPEVPIVGSDNITWDQLKSLFN